MSAFRRKIHQRTSIIKLVEQNEHILEYNFDRLHKATKYKYIGNIALVAQLDVVQNVLAYAFEKKMQTCIMRNETAF